MRVLYVNHTSTVSGGEQSLLTLLGATAGAVEPVVACPPGPLADRVRELGMEVAAIRGTAASLRVHPLHTPRALAELASGAREVGRVAARLGSDLIHANSLRAGLMVSLAAGPGLLPALVHAHDALPPGRLSSATLRTIARRAALILANSAYTEASVRRAAPRARVRVVYNPVDLDRFDPARIDRGEARARVGLTGGPRVLAVVAQITPWKGQDDAVRMLALLRDEHPDVRLLLVGSPKFAAASTRFDNRAFMERLRGLVRELGLDEHVMFLGERDDIPAVLRAIDVLLAPSWEEPFGLSVVEAMAMGVPVAATSVGGPAEVVRDGVDGLLLEPRRPERWAQALTPLLYDGPRLREMGRLARESVRERFSAGAYAQALLGVYADVLAPGIPRG